MNRFDENFGSSIKQMDWSKEKLGNFAKNFYKVSGIRNYILTRNIKSQPQSQKKRFKNS